MPENRMLIKRLAKMEGEGGYDNKGLGRRRGGDEGITKLKSKVIPAAVEN